MVFLPCVGQGRGDTADDGPHSVLVPQLLKAVVAGWIMTERQKGPWVAPEVPTKQVERRCLPDPIDPVYLARMVPYPASDEAAMRGADNILVERGAI